MYAVFLCKGKGATYDFLSHAHYNGFIHEPGGDKDYGYVVVRQQTSGGGYYTAPGACAALYQQVAAQLAKLS
jgi:hypothetical protein